ncbi:YdeI family protein [Spirosoma sp. 209]|uniref:YdeI/OmpD-associated family protein n=1 Tax=Spirosoma sp. 209 TaxID=1955701 RepID=UPI00098D0E60|nr:YdeI/OmpD-associated family protein [Spirosoma sp. 209]
MPATDRSIYYAPTRADWRQWLAEHHATETSVWLKIYKKSSGMPSVTYDQAVDEALCYGWIDSTSGRGDEQYYLQFFARRKPKSNWSRVNKNKVAALTAAGLMTEAGQAMIDLARKTGTWTALDAVEDLICPPDLQTALEANPTARTYFEAFPRSAKRALLEWLLNAKTEQTRARRIDDIVSKAERNERANQYVPKK